MKVKGRIIRLKGSPDVYVVRGHFKRHIANPDTFSAMGATMGEIQTVNQEEFDKYKVIRALNLSDVTRELAKLSKNE